MRWCLAVAEVSIDDQSKKGQTWPGVHAGAAPYPAPESQPPNHDPTRVTPLAQTKWTRQSNSGVISAPHKPHLPLRVRGHGDPPLPLRIARPAPGLQEASGPRRRPVQQVRRLLLAQEADADADAGGRRLAWRRRQRRRELGVVLAPRPRRRGAVPGPHPVACARAGRGVGVRRAQRRAAGRHVRGGRRRRAEPRDQIRREAPRPRPRGPQEHPDQLRHRPQAHEQSRRVRVRGPSSGEVVPDGGGGQQQGDRGARHQPEGGRHHRRPGLRAGRRRRHPRRHRLREPPGAGDGREVQRGDLLDSEAAGGGDRRAAGPGRAGVPGEQAGVQLQEQGGDGGEARAVHARRRRPARHRLRRAHGAVLRLHLQEVIQHRAVYSTVQ